MRLSLSAKRLIGSALWLSSSKFPELRRRLARFGLRTDTEWFEGFTGSAQVPNGNIIRLTNIDKNYLSFELHWKGWRYYEPVTILLLGQLLKQADMFIDVGANVGYYSLVAASENPTLKIVAFEPNPKLFTMLNDNISANGFQIVSEDIAMSDKTGSGEFFVPESDMSGSLEPAFRENHCSVPTVSTITLDDYMRKSPDVKVSLIKIDVEGHEQSVLRGASETLKNIHPDIILEVLQKYDVETESMLKQFGYSFYTITSSGFHHTKHLAPCREMSGYLSYNFLVTVRTPKEVADFYDSVRRKIETLDLSQTTLIASDGKFNDES